MRLNLPVMLRRLFNNETCQIAKNGVRAISDHIAIVIAI